MSRRNGSARPKAARSVVVAAPVVPIEPVVPVVAPAVGRARRWPGRALRIGLGVLALLIVGGVGAAIWAVRHSLPTTSGTLRLAGLSAPVTVVRDGAGMPHLTAANSLDLFRAQGYVVAQDRLWQMDFYRRVGAGRLSEVLGPTPLDTDRFVRTVGWRRAAQKELAALPAEYKLILQAYSDGVNAFLDTHGDELPLEFTILGYKPEHWTPLDTVTFGKVMAWDLSENMNVELTMADLQAKLGVDKAAQYLPAYNDAGTTIVPQSALPGRPAGGSAVAQRLSGVFGVGADSAIGSNNWVIAGSHTSDGKPLLANDPHLRVQNPSIWYAMQLRATDGSLDVAGVTFAGAPGIVVGHNANIAWGVTNLGPDTQDLFVEKLDPAGHPGQYEYKGAWRPLEVISETIPVKGDAGLTLTISSTVHGPLLNGVISQLTAPSALSWTALQPGRLLSAVISVDRAKDWAGFHAALADWSVPGQNFVYADTAGNIGYQATGDWPVRAKGTGLVPVDGSSGDYDWTGLVPYAEMPSVLNPAQGYVVTANNRVVGPNYPRLITGWWFPPFRAERITQMITATAKLSVDDVKRMQYDQHSVLAAAVGQKLAAITGDGGVTEAAARFKGWDGDLSAGSATAALYELTYQQVLTRTLADDLGGTLAGEYLDNLDPAANMLLRNLLDTPQAALWDDTATPAHETRDDILRASLGAAVATLRTAQGEDMNAWSWGALHSITFAHTLGAVPPLDRLFNLGPFPTGGDNTTVNVGSSFENPPGSHQYTQSGHPSMRLIQTPGDWTQTQLVFAPGESGQPGSAHWGDQVDGWLHGTYRTLPWSDAGIRQAGAGTLTLQP